MTFDLVAIITDAKEDFMNPGRTDEFKAPYIICGRYDGSLVTYPDNKPMGYPFDRKIFSLDQDEYKPPRYLEEYVSHIPNMITTQVRYIIVYYFSLLM